MINTASIRTDKTLSSQCAELSHHAMLIGHSISAARLASAGRPPGADKSSERNKINVVVVVETTTNWTDYADHSFFPFIQLLQLALCSPKTLHQWALMMEICNAKTVGRLRYTAGGP